MGQQPPQSEQGTTGDRSTEIVAKLRTTAAEREQSSARDEEKYLMIVAKLSRADAMLMQEAADEIENLRKDVIKMFHALARGATEREALRKTVEGNVQ